MKIQKVKKLPGCEIYTLEEHHDQRGYLAEVYKAPYAQLNLSVSTFGILRGFHSRKKNPEAKLVTVLEGLIHDVVARVGKSVVEYQDINLASGKQLLIPPGYFHAFYTYDDTKIIYACSEVYDPKDEAGFHWSSIPCWTNDKPIVSVKDSKLPMLNEVKFK